MIKIITAIILSLIIQVPLEGGHAEELPYPQNAVDAWQTCLDQLNIFADVVFIGDSITIQSDFTEYFPHKTICNLGISRDTIIGIKERLEMVKAVHPKKVFVLIGINSLQDENYNSSVVEYEALATELDDVESEIYLISILPVSPEYEKEKCSNNIIIMFNNEVKKICKKHNYTYIDLNTQMLLDGYINPKFTIDGLHLSKAGYDIWAESIRQFVEK